MTFGADSSRTSLVGKCVRVSGLDGRPELNGQIGVAQKFVVDKGRYAVRLGDLPHPETVLINEANLEVAPPAEVFGLVSGVRV